MTSASCITSGCDFYGSPENGDRCTVCAGINTSVTNATDEDVMEIFGLSDQDLPSEQQIAERLEFLRTLKPQRSPLVGHIMSLFTAPQESDWPLVVSYDNERSVKIAIDFLGLGPRLRSETCRRIMEVIKDSIGDHVSVAMQKALVRMCIAPWLLEDDTDFSVGVCYFGVGNGSIVSRRSVEKYRDSGTTRSAWKK